MSVSPSSSRSTGPLTVSTVATALSSGRGPRENLTAGAPSGVAGVLVPRAAPGIDGGAEDDAEHGDDDRDDQPGDHRDVGSVLVERKGPENEREQKRKPAPLRRRGIAEPEPG